MPFNSDKNISLKKVYDSTLHHHPHLHKFSFHPLHSLPLMHFQQLKFNSASKVTKCDVIETKNYSGDKKISVYN